MSNIELIKHANKEQLLEILRDNNRDGMRFPDSLVLPKISKQTPLQKAKSFIKRLFTPGY